MLGNIAGKKISIFGFSFKANTNDTRESPAIDICKDLIEEGCFLSIYDPKVDIGQIKIDLGSEPTKYIESSNNYGQWEFALNKNDSVNGSDAILILSDWSEFFNLNYSLLIKKMRRPSWIFDTRNTINSIDAKNCGFKVWSLGDGNIL